MRHTPRKHQQEAINAVAKGFQTSDRGKLLMACGTGKTLTSLWIKERIAAGRTLVLFPSLNLLSQTLKEWQAESTTALSWICVCSDQSVSQRGADEWVDNASDLGIPTTNDPASIQQFLNKTPNGVVFCTYHSSALVAEAQADTSVPHFDLVIADEAHRCVGNASSPFAVVLDGKKIRSSKRLFMTATPRILKQSSKKKANDENIEVACMDDASVYGEVLFELKFSEAIKRGLLSDYKVVVVGVDDPTVQAEIVKNAVVSTLSGKSISSQTLANHIGVSKAIKDYSLQRLITFHRTVQGASDFCDTHKQIVQSYSGDSELNIKSNFVCGEMSSTERNEYINQLKEISGNEVGILSNARCLSEGVDVPALDGIAFIDPRSSVVDIVQAVGRAIRKTEDKSVGYIILPVYLGDTQDVNDEILQTRFSEIWKILLALKSQDDELSATLDQLRVAKGKGQKVNLSAKGMQKIVFDLPSHKSIEFSRSLKAVMLDATTQTWHQWYGKLLKYIEANGNSRVPHMSSGLGCWVARQRRQYKLGQLSKEKIELLEKVGFYWDPIEETWHTHYQELVDYVKVHGNALVNTETSVLGQWVYLQRSAYKKGKLSQHKIELLEAIGFAWDAIEEVWMKNYLDYKKCLELGETINHKHQLRCWTNNQRTAYAKGKISQHKIDLLEAVGFIWNTREHSFNQKCDGLEKFIAKNGYVPNLSNPEFGNFIDRRRHDYKEGKLSQERINRLEQIDGWVWKVR